MNRIILICIVSLLHIHGNANNLSIKNGSVVGNTVSFEIAWDNSWNLTYAGGSHDAVWIFLKGKNSSGNWVHIDLMNESNQHAATGVLTIDAAEDGKGVFVYCPNDGIYSITPTSITIKTINLSDFVELKVFGIEMVHIPEGEFYLGDGASISSLGDSEGNPFLVTSEDEIQGTDLSIVNPNAVFEPQELPSIIPTSFPKGYSDFYVMKYEVSQIQYVDFLNTLTFAQQQKRTASSPTSQEGLFVMVNPNQPDSLYRNGIIIVDSGSNNGKPAVYGMNGNANSSFCEDNDGLNRAANFIGWADLAAYLDWAGLRPLTELEFEKICRGSGIEPVTGEFAWGTNEVTNANNPINDGTVFEAVSDVPHAGSGLANHGNTVSVEGWGLRGVLRTGFAADENSSRLIAGATFYGVMEMSGNVWEQTIMCAGEGINFIGNLGDGMLDENGDANQSSWCNNTTAIGVIYKGGGWGSTISEVGGWRDLAISDRFYSHIKPSQRRNTSGGRGAR